MKGAKAMEKICGCCKWLYDPDGASVCVNGSSENRADFMDIGNSCEQWEGVTVQDAAKGNGLYLQRPAQPQ